MLPPIEVNEKFISEFVVLRFLGKTFLDNYTQLKRYSISLLEQPFVTL